MTARSVKTIVLVLLCGMAAIHVGIEMNSWESVTAGYPDFTIFYSAGKMIRQGMADKLYNADSEWQVQHQVAPSLRNRAAAVPYMHAPFEALIFAPLSFLPYTAAYIFWNVINLIILLTLGLVLGGNVASLQRYSALLPAIFLLGFFPAFNAILEGQDVIWLLLIYGAVYVSLKKNLPFRAGLWLALGLFRVHLVIPFLLFMALQKKWRLLAGFMTAAAALAIVSGLVIGWHGLVGYPLYIWNLEHRLGPTILAARANPNLRGLAVALLLPWTNPSIVTITVISLSVLLIFLVASSWRKPESHPGVFDLQFSLTLIATVLLSYHTLFYDFTILALSAILVWNYVLDNPTLRPREKIRLLAPVALLSFTPLYMVFWVHHWEGSYWMALVLLAWVWALRQEIPGNAVCD
jgi:hypothetical protein